MNFAREMSDFLNNLLHTCGRPYQKEKEKFFTEWDCKAIQGIVFELTNPMHALRNNLFMAVEQNTGWRTSSMNAVLVSGIVYVTTITEM